MNKGTYKREWYQANKERIKKIRNEYYYANRSEIRKRFQAAQIEVLKSWIGVVPEVTTCQMCSRDIYLFTNQCSKSIHFDHRHGGIESIQGAPKHWLRTHVLTPENIAIWKSCDFGMLCWQCNRFLPTKDRMKLTINLMRYMGVNQ